ncbi:hypothetical protein LTR53_016292 [Teratosphaeriaceae sp. CCFEE 6253]|nr:hypothetical protein LTR53_016292 [Teratosphaeriaceae sp. CCFEE 6253]
MAITANPGFTTNGIGYEVVSSRLLQVPAELSSSEVEVDSSKLLQLPPELRNRIYVACLVSSEVIDVAHIAETNEPALLATCKQIRSEALAVFYGGNIFTAAEPSPMRAPSPAVAWLNRIGEARSAQVMRLELHTLGLFDSVSVRWQERQRFTIPSILWQQSEAFKPTAQDTGRRTGQILGMDLVGAGIDARKVEAVVSPGTEELTLLFEADWCAGVREVLDQEIRRRDGQEVTVGTLPARV